jgi:hypothetical protein
MVLKIRQLGNNLQFLVTLFMWLMVSLLKGSPIGQMQAVLVLIALVAVVGQIRIPSPVQLQLLIAMKRKKSFTGCGMAEASSFRLP